MDEITVRCVCGWESTGPTDDVVVATTEHGRRVHNMVATRDQVLAMAIDSSTSEMDAGGVSQGDPAAR